MKNSFFKASYLLFSICTFICLFFSIVVKGVSQQSNLQVQRTHSINPYGTQEALMNNGGTLNIIAVMVEFQPDNNEFTSGTGVFGPGSLPFLESDNITIDPLPHNSAYFKNHLTFVKNYYETVSANQLQVNYQLLPDIIRLDQPMEAFSPIGENFTFEKIADLVEQTWSKVEENGGFNADGLDPEKAAFVIFHAGVGRDIELTGQTLDRTPQDIPSVYMGKRALQVSLGEPQFNGFPVNNGTFRITNSLVIPRTLSRPGEDILGNQFVIQLSINGILTANIGSHLGLPDLFNTEDGSSGIGRFGLMDGEGFLGFAGLFPPEPSAWEKIRMGWQAPFDIDLNQESPISLPAASFHQPSSIARHKITEDEFFLVENRHRDPNNTGVDLTIRNVDGLTTTINFQNADTAFNPVNPDLPQQLPAGVLIDVSNFDWALPGGLDIGDDGVAFNEDDRNLNGGMLIWHIDEAIVEDKIEDLAVNNNPLRRGVDLEEADGPQDIGRAVPNIFGDTNVGRGTPFDFWWSGNNSFVISTAGDTLRLFENRFGPDTQPDNNTNSGAPTFFEFFNFSDNLPTASFQARKTEPDLIKKRNLTVSTLPDVNASIPPTDTFRNNYPTSITPFRVANDTFLIIPAAQKTFALHINDNTGNPVFEFPVNVPQQPLVINSKLILSERPASEDSPITLSAWSFEDDSWQNLWETDITANRGFISSNNSDTILVDFTPQSVDPDNGAAFNAQNTAGISTNNRVTPTARLTETNLISSLFGNFNQVSVSQFDNNFRLYPLALELNPQETAFALITDNSIELVTADQPNFTTVFESTSSIDWPVLTDINKNGLLDFIFVDNKTGFLHGRNRNGSNLNFFPIDPPDGTTFTGTPLLADIESDGSTDIIIAGQDSVSMNIFAYSLDGTPKPNFPLFTGTLSDTKNLALNPVMIGNTLFAISHVGDISAWIFPEAETPVHSFKYGSPDRNKPFGQIGEPISEELFSGILNRRETYNWPNPANQETFLRFQLRDAGNVDIEIISMSGSLMLERKMEVSNSAPVEFRVNTESWGSGAYFARIEARVNGNVERKVIKIAVVH